jgi:anaerobic magnesium-protoporphyrin IX monomethyl ester cyclase
VKPIKTILLATPPYHAGVLESAGLWPPLGLVTIAGELRKHGYAVEIYDSMSLQHTPDEVRAYLRTRTYDVIGVSSITASIVAALDMLRISREEHGDAVAVLGNVHPTFQFAELFSQHGDLFDIVVRGEGEITMPALMDALSRGTPLEGIAGLAFVRDGAVVTTPPREFVANLDLLEPAWDLLDWNLYTFYVMPGSRMATINSSRGCPHNCIFCSQQKFWDRSYRELSAERFVGQLRHLHDRHGVNVVMVSDEYPTRDRERWETILDRIISEGMDLALLLETRVEDILRDGDILWKYRKANILHIYVGVEATNQGSLDAFKKDIKCEQSLEALRLISAAGMISECSFVLGMPDETPATIAATLELSKHYNPDFAHFLAITPWPYSDLFEELKDRIQVWDYAQYNLITPIVAPRLMTLEEVNSAMINCYREFYTWKVPLFRNDPDPFRRDYLTRATRLMMKNSFLKKYMQGGYHAAHSPFDDIASPAVQETRNPV